MCIEEQAQNKNKNKHKNKIQYQNQTHYVIIPLSVFHAAIFPFQLADF